jgi:hypothetical protein
MSEVATVRAVATAKSASSSSQRVLQRKCACGGHTVAGAECEECKRKKTLQRKLAVGSHDDPFEREADAVAEHVMRNRSSGVQGITTPRVQRFSGGEHPTIDVPPSVDRVLATPGTALGGQIGQAMSERFGQDLSRVRVHADPAAQRSALYVNASAYTVGNHIVFGAGRFAPHTADGDRLLAHELTHVVQQSGGSVGSRESGRPAIGRSPILVQRTCRQALGDPSAPCTPNTDSVAGFQFLFRAGCDELLPGEATKISKLTYGRKLRIHGFASREGDAEFNERLSCHRANIVAALAAKQRPECPIDGRFMHGASPDATVATKEAGPRAFWRSVVVEEVRPTREEWLDPTSILSKGQRLFRLASNSPTDAHLAAVAAYRAAIKAWLEATPKSLAPTGRELDRKDQTDYRQLYTSAEFLWKSIDKVLLDKAHPSAKTDTYTEWAVGKGHPDPGSADHAKHVPGDAQYHVDIFGEGYFQGAINIGMAQRTSTTGVGGSRVPNLIYRKFSYKDAKQNRLPFTDHSVDLVTSENGPLMEVGLINEMARIVAPGGKIILYGPDNMEEWHDKAAKAVRGSIVKYRDQGGIESVISVPTK